MIDIHAHVLPDLDDGSPDMATSLEMCRMAVADGITDVVATPHYQNGVGVSSVSVIPPALDGLRRELEKAGIPLHLHMALEMPLREDCLPLYRDGTWLAYDAARKYILLECPAFPVQGVAILSRTVERLVQAGAIPVLAHPERLPFLDNPADAGAIRRLGAPFQVTAQALDSPTSSGHRARAWLERGWVDAIATDAHGLHRRPPRLSRARDFVASRFGDNAAELLATRNPMKILAGEPL